VLSRQLSMLMKRAGLPGLSNRQPKIAGKIELSD
jgi:hypothetical protein